MKQKGLLILHLIIIGIVGYLLFQIFQENNSIESNTIIEPNPFDVSTKKGFVIGQLCYGSDFLPSGEIVAKEIISGNIYTEDYKGRGSSDPNSSYKIELAPGTYHIKYQAHLNSGVKESEESVFSYYHTPCAKKQECGNSNADYEIVDVKVESGKTISGVDLCSMIINSKF